MLEHSKLDISTMNKINNISREESAAAVGSTLSMATKRYSQLPSVSLPPSLAEFAHQKEHNLTIEQLTKVLAETSHSIDSSIFIHALILIDRFLAAQGLTLQHISAFHG